MTDLPVIDIHAHILPGLDDGSPSWEDSLEMAAQAVDSGVTAIAATSHANLPGQSGSWEKAKYQGIFRHGNLWGWKFYLAA